MRKFHHFKHQRLPILLGFVLAVSVLLTSLLSNGISLSFLPESWQLGFAYDVENGAMPTVSWLVLYTVATVFLVVGSLWLQHRAKSPSFAIIIGFALLLRLVSSFGEPIHESDFYRYLWDGKSAAAGVNPYQFEPGAILIADGTIGEEEPVPDNGVAWAVRGFTDSEKALLEELENIRDANPEGFSRVSHPSVPTIYPPAAQALFLFVVVTFGDSLSALRTVLIALDLAVVFLILKLLQQFRLPRVYAILYAWHPLVLKETTNSAHFDVLAILCGMLALWGVVCFRKSAGVAVWAGFWLGVGILAKYFILLLLPVLVFFLVENRDPSSRRIQGTLRNPRAWLMVCTTGAVVFLGFLPYAIWNGVGWARLFEGLLLYREFWQYNPGIFGAVEIALRSLGDIRSFSHAGMLCLGALAGTVLVIVLRPLGSKKEGAVRCFQVLAALFVLSQTAFPWYLCWALAFLPFRPRISWLWLSLVWPWNYLDFQPESVSHFSWNGFYVLSSLLWLSFAVIWICETTFLKFPLRAAWKSERI